MAKKNQPDGKDVLTELKQATKGLLFMSESEYPFEVIHWDKTQEITPDFLRKEAGKSAEDPVEEKSVDDFFKQAASMQDWYGKAEKATAKKYQALVKLIKEKLEDVKVYRVGRVKISVFIVGKVQGGAWAGLSTQVVET